MKLPALFLLAVLLCSCGHKAPPSDALPLAAWGAKVERLPLNNQCNLDNLGRLTKGSGGECVMDLDWNRASPPIVLLTGSCAVGEYLSGEGKCVDAVTKKVSPLCAGSFKGRCAKDAHSSVVSGSVSGTSIAMQTRCAEVTIHTDTRTASLDSIGAENAVLKWDYACPSRYKWETP